MVDTRTVTVFNNHQVQNKIARVLILSLILLVLKHLEAPLKLILLIYKLRPKVAEQPSTHCLEATP